MENELENITKQELIQQFLLLQKSNRKLELACLKKHQDKHPKKQPKTTLKTRCNLVGLGVKWKKREKGRKVKRHKGLRAKL